MTRSKKSRKPGASSGSVPKPRQSDKDALALLKDKRTRKKTGNKPGTRQNVINSTNDADNNKVAKDPRIGSKKPIDLGVKVEAKLAKAIKKPEHKSSVAPIRVIEPQQDNLQVALDKIENDQKLQEILAKQEDDIALTEFEVDYYNELMAEHEELSQKLGLIDDDEPAEQSTSLSEDDLWSKFNDNNFDDNFVDGFDSSKES